jgi:D-alanine-D-alanine ligase-like ATP-grasp enzyme
MADYQEARKTLSELGFPRHWGNIAVVHEALRRGVEVSKADRRPRIAFRHGGEEHRWQSGWTTLNSPLARKIGRFKDLQSRIFLNHGVNAPEGAIFLPGQAERAWHWAAPLETLVVKPHNGTHGNDVHVGVENWDEFLAAFERVSDARGQVLVEKFHAGVEHRCLMVDNRLVAATRRRPASVVGDGTSTIEELVRLKNKNRGKIHKPLRMRDQERHHLAAQNLSFDSVPPDGDRVYLLGTSNVHTGGDALDATKEITKAERTMIKKAAKAIPGLRVVGMDVLLPRSPGDSEPTVIEVNEAPMISMHHFPWEGRRRNVARHIMDAMFPETKLRE